MARQSVQLLGFSALALALAACGAPAAPTGNSEAAPAALVGASVAGTQGPAPQQAYVPGEIGTVDCSRGVYDMMDPTLMLWDEWNMRIGAHNVYFSELQTAPTFPYEVCGVDGEQDRIYNLACNDGTNPFFTYEEIAYHRTGNVGPGGRCGHIIDHYQIPCPEGLYDVYMDMYMCPEESF